MRHHLVRSFIVLGALLLVGCGTPNPGPADAGLVCPTTPIAVTTAKLQVDVITPICASCHKTAGTAVTYGVWDTAEHSQAAMVGVASIYNTGTPALKVVDPRKLANSTTYLKLLGGSPTFNGPHGENIGGQMPSAATPPVTITAEQIDEVRNWICSGAVAQ